MTCVPDKNSMVAAGWRYCKDFFGLPQAMPVNNSA